MTYLAFIVAVALLNRFRGGWWYDWPWVRDWMSLGAARLIAAIGVAMSSWLLVSDITHAVMSGVAFYLFTMPAWGEWIDMGINPDWLRPRGYESNPWHPNHWIMKIWEQLRRFMRADFADFIALILRGWFMVPLSVVFWSTDATLAAMAFGPLWALSYAFAAYWCLTGMAMCRSGHIPIGEFLSGAVMASYFIWAVS